jgi:two-component system, OmpR family, clock-associated histidine kinase SasA
LQIKFPNLQDAIAAFNMLTPNSSNIEPSVLQPFIMQTAPGQDTRAPVSIQLLLFVDERPSSQEIIQQIKNYLQSLQTSYNIDLRTFELAQEPHLVEHFKLIATPALVKIFPEPRQTLAGSNVVEQLKKWCPRWQLAIEQQIKDELERDTQARSPKLNDVGHAGEIIRLSDEVFRLKQDKEELLEQLKFKDRVLAMLAHDLRSPLTAASIAVETLELTQDRENNERTRQLKEQLYRQARKQFRIMNRIITEILQASKTMNGELGITNSQVFLQTLCEDILAQFAKQFQAKSQNVEKDIPQDLPPVYADAELIGQVLVNLLDNAWKYTPEGGKITVSVLHRTTQKIQVSVGDTGPGIPQEKRERIFEGHFRLKRDESKEGYGLGLSMCRQIVRAHYGQIWVESDRDRGSCFHFTLPTYR